MAPGRCRPACIAAGGTGEPAGHERASNVTAVLMRWQHAVPGSLLDLCLFASCAFATASGIGLLPPTRDPRARADWVSRPACPAWKR
jgi:hypothetical protein